MLRPPFSSGQKSLQFSVICVKEDRLVAEAAPAVIPYHRVTTLRGQFSAFPLRERLL